MASLKEKTDPCRIYRWLPPGVCFVYWFCTL